PSAAALAWRDVLAQACLERNWDFVVHQRGGAIPSGTPDRSLLVVAWLDEVGELEDASRAVQLSPPQEALAAFRAVGNINDQDALYGTSLRLAAAWELSERGAPTSWSDDPEIVLAGLGRVAGPVIQTTPDADSADHPLSMFERGARAGVRATRWKPDIFLYPDARPSEGPIGSFPLLGRRRLLLNGPNIFLPAGTWSFVAEISIDPPGKTELLIEWGHGYDVASLLTPIEAAGKYEVSLVKKWDAFQPADFRISLMIPALDGEICFHGGTLTRRDDI
ncbi:MAG: hypothetical protein VX755_08845, partial [Pseudomonadota bacterium]|nr:hypothetical protein [Pseudomonadota bacterium]